VKLRCAVAGDTAADLRELQVWVAALRGMLNRSIETKKS
jgi:hypothetical protein